MARPHLYRCFLFLETLQRNARSPSAESIIPDVSGLLQCTIKPLGHGEPLLTVMKIPSPKQSQLPHVLVCCILWEDLTFFFLKSLCVCVCVWLSVCLCVGDCVHVELRRQVSGAGSLLPSFGSRDQTQVISADWYPPSFSLAQFLILYEAKWWYNLKEFPV